MSKNYSVDIAAATAFEFELRNVFDTTPIEYQDIEYLIVQEYLIRRISEIKQKYNNV